MVNGKLTRKERLRREEIERRKIEKEKLEKDLVAGGQKPKE